MTMILIVKARPGELLSGAKWILLENNGSDISERAVETPSERGVKDIYYKMKNILLNPLTPKCHT